MAKSWENMIYSKKNPDFLDIFFTKFRVKTYFFVFDYFWNFFVVVFSQKTINPEILWGKK